MQCRYMVVPIWVFYLFCFFFFFFGVGLSELCELLLTHTSYKTSLNLKRFSELLNYFILDVKLVSEVCLFKR